MSLNDCFWIRCNRCVSGLSQTQLYLTNCGHIFCLPCLGLETKDDRVDCPNCKSSTHLLEINSRLGQSKSVYFKDPEIELKETQKKIDKIRSFQKYHYENNIRNMAVQVRKAAEATNALEKMKEEFKKREAQLLTAMKEKDAMLKEKEEENSNLKDKITQLNQLASKYKKGGRALQERVRELELHSQKSKENLLAVHGRLESMNLKRRRENDDKIGNQKPVFDVSQVSFNLQRGMNQPTEKKSRSSGCISLERPKAKDPQFQHFRQPSVPKFKPAKNFFALEDSKVDESFGFPGIGDETISKIGYNKPKQAFRPLSTSTQRRVDMVPAISQDGSIISEIPYFNN
uniref:RING-type domain-containing protein n=1 Tax=Strongyloides papillosus TaxID=174720 RepID=A0A0N5B202_STREA